MQTGEQWVLARDPGGLAGFLLYGVDDPGKGPEMLHLAETEFAVQMPASLGKLTQFPSGIRMMVVTEDRPGADGAPLRTAWLTGASPRLHPKGAAGVLAFWRVDASAEQLQTVQAALDSLAAF